MCVRERERERRNTNTYICTYYLDIVYECKLAKNTQGYSRSLLLGPPGKPGSAKPWDCVHDGCFPAWVG